MSFGVRVGAVAARSGAVAATIRGTREALAGYRRAVIDLPTRPDGTPNAVVIGALARRFPRLFAGLQEEAMAAVSSRFAQGGIRVGLEELALFAGRGIARGLAARLRSGRYVTNLPETRARKARLGLSLTPGVATGELATALDNARVHVE